MRWTKECKHCRKRIYWSGVWRQWLHMETADDKCPDRPADRATPVS